MEKKYLHSGIIDGSQGRFKVSRLTLVEPDALQRVPKHWDLWNNQFLLCSALVLRFQVADLLQGVRVLALQKQSTSSCHVRKMRNQTVSIS